MGYLVRTASRKIVKTTGMLLTLTHILESIDHASVNAAETAEISLSAVQGIHHSPQCWRPDHSVSVFACIYPKSHVVYIETTRSIASLIR